MYIDEFLVGDKITIKAKASSSELEFETEITQDENVIVRGFKTVVCKPIIIEGKILSFNNVQITASILHEGRVYEYVVSRIAITKKTRNLVLCSNVNASPMNYRSSYRVPCSYKAVLQIGANRKAIDATVHDISYTGVSYLFTRDTCRYNIGDKVSASIYDKDGNCFKLPGTIVRDDTHFSDNIMLIGVRFSPTTDPGRLVAKAQLADIRVRHS